MRDVSVLVVDDEEPICEICSRHIQSLGYSVDAASSAPEALEKLKEGDYHVVLADIRMPGMDGMELLRRIKQYDPKIEVILMTGYGSIQAAVEAMKEGAYDFITKPFHTEEFKRRIKRLVDARALRDEVLILRRMVKARHGFENIVGNSPPMQAVFSLVSKVCANESTVLITGESGTGKEIIARAIHFNGPRASLPFITIDLSSMSPHLVESELFGHLKGSFTGAYTDKKGLFEVAEKGTVFLDEIGDLPKMLQPKLLRVLQERRVKRVGGTESFGVDVRILAATNRDLERGVQTGVFREDLYYRLNVVPVRLPALRERRDDIPLLVNHFIKRHSTESSHVKTISSDAMEALKGYRWPGNVRELENVVQRAVVLCRNEVLQVDDIPEYILSDGPGFQGSLAGMGHSLEEIERDVIARTLVMTGDNKLRAAEILKIDRSTLYRKIKRYGL